MFGIGGTLILLFFIGILWFWAKERMALKEASTAAADLKLVGYVFMLIAAWFICGIASIPFLKALENEPPQRPHTRYDIPGLGVAFSLPGSPQITH